jgi:hypothetical protein
MVQLVFRRKIMKKKILALLLSWPYCYYYGLLPSAPAETVRACRNPLRRRFHH